MKCSICGHEINPDNHNRCERFPICRYIDVEETKMIINEDSYIVFDIETTGFDKTKNRIIEIGAVKVKNGKIIDEYNRLINPGKDEAGNQIFISARISDITGITNNMVQNEDIETLVVKDFINWIGEYKTFAGQNVIRFDIPFLKAAAKRADIKFDCTQIIDILVYAKRLKLKERGLVENLKQPTLAKYYGFTYHAHRALDDVKACNKILVCMKKDGKKYGVDIRPEVVKRN